MDASAQQFLRRACATVQKYDRDGCATAPVAAWPLILEDLGVVPEDAKAELLKDYLQAAEQGFFTYKPLLEALGAVPVTDSRNGVTDTRKSDTSVPTNGVVKSTSDLPVRPPPIAMEHFEDMQRGFEVESADSEEDPETFWARRASTIQYYYNMWDCNTLSNEAFTTHLQNTVGDHADVTSADSEVIRLTNQHRFARNLRFGKLMEALRRDAKRMGFGTSSYAGSSTGSSRGGSISGSICGDLRPPSEAPSETPSYAAGRPANLLSGGFVGVGRKHYAQSETPSLLGEEDAFSSRGIGIKRDPKPRTPAPFANLSDVPVNQRQAPPPRTPAPYEPLTQQTPSARREAPETVTPFASGGNFEAGYRRPARPPAQGPNPDFWKPKASVACDERSDVASQCGARSEVSVSGLSVADSQREVFAARNRGHGNILTWGNDSRDLTPTKKRGGRQHAVNADGMSKAHATSGVFPLSPQS